MPNSNQKKRVNKIFQKKDFKSFSRRFKSANRVAHIIGVVFIVFSSLLVVYIGSWRAAYAKQFYNVKFTINFLEGVSPGMKIRYQGGSVVGEILAIESDYHTHYLTGRIKKDFLISKRSSRVNLRQAGVFGQDYIDVYTFPVAFYDKFYEEGDIIPVDPITPRSVTIINLSKMLKSDEHHLIPLGKKLIEIKNMIYKLRKNQYFISSEARYSILNAVNKTRKSIDTALIYGNSAYETVIDMDHTLTTLANNLRKNIPIMSRQVYGTKDFLSYQNSPQFSQFFHDEYLYSTILMRLRIINRKLKSFKAEPYRLIYN